MALSSSPSTKKKKKEKKKYICNCGVFPRNRRAFPRTESGLPKKVFSEPK
jgi:hypothetical protein